jgi:hypothetical protein
MAIVIINSLEAHPSQIPLPGGTQLSQSLQSVGLPQEHIRLEYWLDPNGDVAFGVGIYTLIFHEDVGSGGADITHNVSFINVTGQPVGSFQVNEFIIDSQGEEISDLCRVDVQ